MKYGIRATHPNGTVTYCASTKQPWFSDDIDEMATFVQEKSAIKALKSLRADWYDRLTNVDLDVVTVSLSVMDTTSVPAPYPANPGFIVVQDLGDKFSYLRSNSGWCNWNETIAYASVYGSHEEALEAMELAQSEVESGLQQLIGLRYQMGHRMIFNQAQHDIELDQLNNRIDRLQQEAVRMGRLTIQAV